MTRNRFGQPVTTCPACGAEIALQSVARGTAWRVPVHGDNPYAYPQPAPCGASNMIVTFHPPKGN